MGGLKDIKVLGNTSFEAKQYDGAQAQREAATPSKPAVYFHSEDQVFLTKAQVEASGTAKPDTGKKGKKGGKQEEQK